MLPNHPTVRRTMATTAALVLAATGVLAGCGSDSEDSADTTVADSGSESTTVTVNDPWARPGTAGGNSAIYMELEGGDTADALVSAAVPGDVAATTEIHETVAADDSDMSDSDMGDSDMSDSDMGDSDMSDSDMGEDDADHGSGMMTMQPVDSIEVPAGETVTLEPGGYHVMLLDLQGDLEPGATVEVTLTFESGDEQVIAAEVKEP